MAGPEGRDRAARCISIPADGNRGSFNLEALKGDRLALRVGRHTIFLTFTEARRILAALSTLLGVETQPSVRL